MKKMQGFTLIELMIVIAILAILMAIAIPAYQDYTVRAKVSEGVNLAGAAKLAVSETYQSTGRMPPSNISAGLPAAASIVGNNVTSVGVGAGGVIAITYNNAEPKLDGKLLHLSPFTDAGSVQWACGTAASNVDNKFRPATCR